MKFVTHKHQMHRHDSQPTFQQNEKVAKCPENELNSGGNFINVDMRRQTETSRGYHVIEVTGGLQNR